MSLYVRPFRNKKEVSPSNFEREHSDKGRGNSGLGLENKLEVVGVMGGEVGVLVREVTGGVMDTL